MEQFKTLLVAEVRRRLLQESIPRVKKCLDQLTEDEIWFRPNHHSNSVGNLVLHLCGNARQWLLSGLGRLPDRRNRQSEFDERGPIPKAELLRQLDELAAAIDRLLDQLTPQQILQSTTVQGFQETGLSILIHVVEHFSYHTGQITYFVKWRKNMDMGYYAGMKLDTTSP